MGADVPGIEQCSLTESLTDREFLVDWPGCREKAWVRDCPSQPSRPKRNVWYALPIASDNG